MAERDRTQVATTKVALAKAFTDKVDGHSRASVAQALKCTPGHISLLKKSKLERLSLAKTIDMLFDVGLDVTITPTIGNDVFSYECPLFSRSEFASARLMLRNLRVQLGKSVA